MIAATGPLPESIAMIDAQYMHPKKCAIYVIREGDRLAIVDPNTNFAVPVILASLKELGYSADQVEYIILTHIHLDHAGGTGELLKSCPNARVLAHPKAARHAADPSRLEAGARALYGDEDFDALYGTIAPVPQERICALEDGENLAWGERTLTFLHTKGHATHHFCIHDSGSNSVFAGDNFGLGRNTDATAGPIFLMCTSSPVEFDAKEARISLARILDLQPDWIFIGHYGAVKDVAAGGTQVGFSIDQMEAILLEAAETEFTGEELDQWCEEKVWTAFREHLTHFGSTTIEKDLAYLKLDAFLNSRGLSFAAARARTLSAGG